MATPGLKTIEAKTVTQFTDSEVSGALTFQNVAGDEVRLIGTTDGTAPSASDFDDGLLYKKGQGEANTTLDELFPGQSYVRLWAYSIGGCYMTGFHA